MSEKRNEGLNCGDKPGMLESSPDLESAGVFLHKPRFIERPRPFGVRWIRGQSDRKRLFGTSHFRFWTLVERGMDLLSQLAHGQIAWSGNVYERQRDRLADAFQESIPVTLSL